MKKVGIIVTWPLVSGALAGLTLIAKDFVPYSHVLIFVCYVPLYWSWLRSEKAATALLQGWVAQAMLSLVAFHWVTHTVAEFGQVPFAAAVGAFLLFAALGNLHLPAGAYFWARFFPEKSASLGGRIFALVLFQAAAERLVPMLFDWHLGYAWYYLGWPGFQVADVIGFAGLGTLTLAVNGLFTYALLRRGRSRVYALAGVAALLAAVNIAGAARARLLPAPDVSLRALVVQANIGNRDKLREDDPAYRPELVRRYLRLTDQGLAAAKAEGKTVDFAVWAETAFPDVISELGSVETHFQELQNFLVGRGLTLVTGGYGFDNDGKTTNALFVIPPVRTWRFPTYHKSYLLAFGEYLPGAGWFPALREMFPAVGNFAAGRGPTVLPLAGAHLGPQICYEGLFDGFARASANLGADFFVNLTNDSWYGAGQEPRQHLYLTLGRAIENRRPLLRATNTGISAVVLANGDLTKTSPENEAWAGLFEIPYVKNPRPTPFQTWGYWLMPALIALGLAVAFAKRRRGPGRARATG